MRGAARLSAHMVPMLPYLVIMYETAAREPRNFDGCDTCHVNTKDTDYCIAVPAILSHLRTAVIIAFPFSGNIL